MVDISKLDRIIQKTKKIVEKSREELYQLGEAARRDYEHTKQELAEIKVKIKDNIFELMPEELKKLLKENQAIALKINGEIKDLSFISSLNEDEEIEIIIPTINNSQYKDSLYGPFPADAFFGNKLYKNFDFIIGHYHDQVLIPFKLLSFEKGVNFTAGLNLIFSYIFYGLFLHCSHLYIVFMVI